MRVKKTGVTFRPAGSSSEDDDDCYGFGDGCERSYRRSSTTFARPSRNSPQPVDYFEEFMKEINEGSLQGVADALLKVPLKIDLVSSGGWNALMNACHLGFVNIVEFLLEKGADPHFSNNELFTPLMAACSSYCLNEEHPLQCIKLLFKNDVNIDAKDQRGVTALMYACKSGHVTLVQALVDNNANLNVQDRQGWTALFWAVNNGSFSIVEILVKVGAIKKKKDDRGQTAFEMAFARGGLEQIVRLLCPRKLRDEFLNVPENEDSDLDEVENETMPFEFVNTQLPEIKNIDISNRKVTKETHLQQGLDMTTFLTISDKELLDMGVKYPWHRRQTLEYIKTLHMQTWKRYDRLNQGLEEKKAKSEHLTYATAIKYMLEFCTRITMLQASIAYLNHQCPLERMVGSEKVQRTFVPKTNNTIGLSKEQANKITAVLNKITINLMNAASEVVSPSDLPVLTHKEPPRRPTFSSAFSVHSSLVLAFAATGAFAIIVLWKIKPSLQSLMGKI